MKKAVFGFVAALALAGGLFAQQGIVIPGTPGPVNPVLISVDPVAGSTCSKPAIVEFNYVSYGVWVCGSTGGSVSAPFVWMPLNLSTGLIPGKGPSVASATTIAPLYTFQHVTGTTAIATITAPAGAQSGTQVTLVFDAVASWTAAGNIAVASANVAPGGTAGSQLIVAGQAYVFTYDSVTTKWYPTL